MTSAQNALYCSCTNEIEAFDMSDHIDRTIADLQGKLKEQEDAVTKTKQLINLLCEQVGRPSIYKDAEMKSSSVGQSFAQDEFYGQPLAGAVKKILQRRKEAGNGPATPREIYDTLVSGGYAFETDHEQNRLTGLRISLRKASTTFHRLPDGKTYGLLEWYPKAKKQKSNEDSQSEDETDDVVDAGDAEENA